MNYRNFVVAGVVLLSGVANLTAQTQSQFGTCAYWQDQKPDPKIPAPSEKSYCRIGFAHGFVFGVLGDLPTEPRSDGGWALLESRYDEGLVEALRRPAFLVDALDQKCGDYRNRRVRLNDIGLLVLLEVGGMPAQQIEQALEVMRVGGNDYKARALEVLSSSPSR